MFPWRSPLSQATRRRDSALRTCRRIHALRVSLDRELQQHRSRGGREGAAGDSLRAQCDRGVVQVLTRNPSNRPELETQLGYGSYDTWSAETYARARGGPLREDLLANLAAYWSDQSEGWGHNVTTGAQTFKSRDYGGRAKLLWTPAARTSALLSIDFDKTVAQEGVGFAAWPGTGSLDPLLPFPNGAFAAARGYYDLSENFTSGDNDRQYGGSLKLTQRFDWARLVSISAYRDTLVTME